MVRRAKLAFAPVSPNRGLSKGTRTTPFTYSNRPSYGRYESRKDNVIEDPWEKIKAFSRMEPLSSAQTQTQKSSGTKVKTQTKTVPAIEPTNGEVQTTRGKSRMDLTTTTQSVKVDMAGPVKQRSFYTNFYAGKPTAKWIKVASSIHGQKSIELWNSRTDTLFKDPSKAEKEYNEIVTGFGQKIFYTSKYLTPSWQQVLGDLYGVGATASTASSPNPDEVSSFNQYLNAYGAMKSLRSRLTFRNNMNTTSAVVKLHLIVMKNAPTQTDYKFDGPINRMTSATAGFALEPIETERLILGKTAYPRPYTRIKTGTDESMKTSTPDTAGSHAIYCLTVPGVSPTESETFNDSYSIIKTFKKTLDVGDDWTFDYTYTFGTGIRLDEALRMYNLIINLGSSGVAADIPLPYRIMVEVVGKNITAEANKLYTPVTTGTPAASTYWTGEDKFVGTSPCSVTWEGSHRVTYVLNSYAETGTPTYSPSTTSMATGVGGPLVRYFVKDITTKNIPFNVDYWKTNSGILTDSPLIIKSQTNATVQTVTTTT